MLFLIFVGYICTYLNFFYFCRTRLLEDSKEFSLLTYYIESPKNTS